jgi:uncharacterized protein (DUF3084 family)
MTDVERLLAFVEREIVEAEADYERYKSEQRAADARYTRGYLSCGGVIRRELQRIQADEGSP